MFDSTHPRIFVLRNHVASAGLPGPDRLKEDCLDSASLWALRRRATRPHRGPDRLPGVARVG